MRKLTSLMILAFLLYFCGYTSHTGAINKPISEIYSLPDQSFVEVSGVITGVVARSGSYVNFDIKDDTAHIHVYWKFPDGHKPEWLIEGQLVLVSGRYWVSHPRHNWEPEIVAYNVRLYGPSQETVTGSDTYITLIPWGAAGEVAGSCYQLSIVDKSILIDCGSFMNGDDEDNGGKGVHRDTDPFPFDPSRINALLITHAHDDHIGRIHYLVYNGFRGPICFLSM